MRDVMRVRPLLIKYSWIEWSTNAWMRTVVLEVGSGMTSPPAQAWHTDGGMRMCGWFAGGRQSSTPATPPQSRCCPPPLTGQRTLTNFAPTKRNSIANHSTTHRPPSSHTIHTLQQHY